MNNWLWIFNGFLSLFLLGLCDNIRGPIFPQILEQFGLTDFAGSLFFAIGSGASFFGSLVTPAFTRQWGELRSMQVFQLIMGLSMGALVICESYWQMLIFVAIFGVTLGALSVLQSSVVAAGSSRAQRSRWLAGLHSMYGLASFLAPLFLKFFWVWDRALAALAGVCVVLSVGAFFSVKRHKKISPLDAENASSDSTSLARMSWLAPTVLATYVVSELAISTRLALFLQRQEAFSVRDASVWVSLFFALLLCGRLCFFFLRVESSIRYIVLVSQSVALVSFLAGLMYRPEAFLICGLAMAPIYPLYVAHLSSLYNSKDLQKILGRCLCIQAFMVVAMHLGLGWLSDQFGLRQALFIGPFAMLLSLLAFFRYEVAANRSWFKKMI